MVAAVLPSTHVEPYCTLMEVLPLSCVWMSEVTLARYPICVAVVVAVVTVPVALDASSRLAVSDVVVFAPEQNLSLQVYRLPPPHPLISSVA